MLFIIICIFFISNILSTGADLKISLSFLTTEELLKTKVTSNWFWGQRGNKDPIYSKNVTMLYSTIGLGFPTLFHTNKVSLVNREYISYLWPNALKKQYNFNMTSLKFWIIISYASLTQRLYLVFYKYANIWLIFLRYKNFGSCISM